MLSFFYIFCVLLGTRLQKKTKVLDKVRFEDEKAFAMGEQLDDEEKVDFVSRKLWISKNLVQYQKEKQEEYLRSNPNQMKRYLRWKKTTVKFWRVSLLKIRIISFCVHACALTTTSCV